MTGRLLAYVAGSYPPKVYLPLAVAWTVGASGVTALTDDRVIGWVPDPGVLASASTMAVVLLVMRVLDDIRDLDYDREHNPRRPLAAGVVTVRDLLVLVAASAVLALLLNTWRWPVLCVLAGLLAYVFLFMWSGWAPGEAMIIGLFVSLPVHLLTNAFLYAGLLYSLDLRPSWSGAAGMLVVALAFFHLEFARKTTRVPQPGERTYVTVFGTTGTAVLALACAVGSTALLVATVRPWHPVVLLAVLPLAYPALAAARFHRDRLVRWPYGLAAGYVMTSYTAFAVVALIERVLA